MRSQNFTLDTCRWPNWPGKKDTKFLSGFHNLMIYKGSRRDMPKYHFNHLKQTYINCKGDSKSLSSLVKMKTFYIHDIARVSFCILRYDCYVRTIMWQSSNNCFLCKYEELAKVGHVIFYAIFNWTWICNIILIG